MPANDGSPLVVVGDVSGKGLRAAMTVSAIVGALRGHPNRRPALVLAVLNRVLCGQIPKSPKPPNNSASTTTSPYFPSRSPPLRTQPSHENSLRCGEGSATPGRPLVAACAAACCPSEMFRCRPGQQNSFRTAKSLQSVHSQYKNGGIVELLRTR